MPCSYRHFDCDKHGNNICLCGNEDSERYNTECHGKCSDYFDLAEEDPLYGLSPEDGGYEDW